VPDEPPPAYTLDLNQKEEHKSDADKKHRPEEPYKRYFVRRGGAQASEQHSIAELSNS
jgi:hypothetical protein